MVGEVQPSAITIQLPQGPATAQEIAERIGKLSRQEFLATMRAIIEHGHADDFRDLFDALEILSTQSAFEDPEKVTVLESVAQDHNFEKWLTAQGVSAQACTREHVILWWDYFMAMCNQRGYQPTGHINPAGGDTNLWKATNTLAHQIAANPARYAYLPAYLINNPDQVGRKLNDIQDPRAFLEVLSGEAFGDMKKSPKFLAAFSPQSQKDDPEQTTAQDDPDRITEQVVASTMLILQRDQLKQ